MEQTKTRSPADAKYYINSLIGLFFILGFGHIPAIEPLTQVGMQIAGIFIGLIYLWSTVDLIWPSILGILAFGLSDYCTMTEAIASGLGSQVVWMLIMLMMISEAIRVSGVGEIIARWIITRRVLNGRPLLFTFMYLWGFFICTILLQQIAAIFLSWAIFYSIAELVGYQKGDRYSTMMIIGSLLASVVGGGIIPFQGWMLALCQTYGEASGTPVNYIQYMLVALVLGSVLMLLVALSIKYVFRCDLEKLKNFDVSTLSGETSLRLNYKQACYLGSFAIIIVYMLLTTILPAEWALTQLMNRFSQAGIFGILVVLLCLVRVNGEPLLDFRETAEKGINWNVILICSSAIPIASALTSDVTGVKVLFTNLLSPVFSGIGVLPFLAIIVVATVILTNVGSNIGVAMMLIPIILPFVDGLGISPAIPGMAIIFIANLGFVLPGSSAMAPFLYSNDWVQVRDIYKYGIFYCLLFVLEAVPILYLFSRFL